MVGDPRTATQGTAAAGNGQGNAAQVTPLLGFAASVDAYSTAGWIGTVVSSPGIDRDTGLPRPPTAKIPHYGHTGIGKPDPTADQIEQWKKNYPLYNLLLRLATTQAGLDFDAYGDKTGKATHAEGVKRWGKLPPAWRSTARIDDPLSGIYLYEIDDGVILRGELSFKDLDIGDVEIIQHHHRTVCAWGSTHPKLGRLYRWFDPDGALTPEGTVPPATGHPRLPDAWVDGLRNTKANRNRERPPKTPRQRDNDLPLYDIDIALTDGMPNAKISTRLTQAIYDLRTADPGKRHNIVRDHVMALMSYGAKGAPGVKFSIAELERVFLEVTTK
jgi:hypothetical protein